MNGSNGRVAVGTNSIGYKKRKSYREWEGSLGMQ